MCFGGLGVVLVSERKMLEDRMKMRYLCCRGKVSNAPKDAN